MLISTTFDLGTAVWVEPQSDAAKRQYEAVQTKGQMPHQATDGVRVSGWDAATGAGRPPGT